MRPNHAIATGLLRHIERLVSAIDQGAAIFNLIPVSDTETRADRANQSERHVGNLCAHRLGYRHRRIDARFGGEEFVLMLRETRIDAAMAIAEAVRGKIANVPFDLVGTVSASFGVAEWNQIEDGRALINRADKALYVAKQTGRNRVVRADEDEVIERRGA